MCNVDRAIEALKRPSDFGWFGRDDMFETWGMVGPHLVINADDVLAESNYETTLKLLEENFGSPGSDYGPNIEVTGIKHWAVGSMDTVSCRVVKKDSAYSQRMEFVGEKDTDLIDEEDLTEEFLFLCGLADALEQYPVLDEEDYSNREYERALEYIGMDFTWYSDGSDGWEGDVFTFLWDQNIDPANDHIEVDDVIHALLLSGKADLDDEKVQEFMADHPEVLVTLYQRAWKEAGQLELEV